MLIKNPSRKPRKPRPARSNNSNVTTVKARLAAYLLECQRRGAVYIRFRIDDFVRRLNVSRRSIIYARIDLEAEGWRFCKKRVGRSDCLFVVFNQSKFTAMPEPKMLRKPGSKTRDRKAVHGATNGGIGGKGDFSSKNKEIKKHRKAAVPLKNKAWWVMRRLEESHWDNCKVRYRSRHAWNFAFRGLEGGHSAEIIIGCYRQALQKRHQDATDMGLNAGNPAMHWEPSSTVSLARQRLNQHQSQKEYYLRRSAYRKALGRMNGAEYEAWRVAAVERVGEEAYYAETPELLEFWVGKERTGPAEKVIGGRR